MAQTTGMISYVQENRFVLDGDDGRKRLFLLSPRCSQLPEDLRAAQKDRFRVQVDYEPQSDVVAGQAQSIRAADSGTDRLASRSLWRTITGALRDWSLPRQLSGQSAKSEAARSSESERVGARLKDADTIGTSICPYCAVGCAQLVYARDNQVIHVEGDPRSPVNEGTLCPKGAATLGLLNAPDRLQKVLYRPPGGEQWEERSLEWAMDRIAQKVKQTRDETFVERLPNGCQVNHTLGLASLGGATLDVEENYLIKKLFGGGLGMTWIENQARVCHSPSVPGLGATFGRGASTLPEWDLANSDCVVIMGSNMAENHPVAFRFVTQAQERGARIVHVDPRFTRTSAMADIHAPIRTGTDIAFLGGIIRYLLENDLWFREYALAYTNIATIIEDDFEDADADGLFSGWQADKRAYQFESWQYRGESVPSPVGAHSANPNEPFGEKAQRMAEQPTPQDETLQHPHCVYQILRRHYASYTPEMVERVTGCPQETFLKVADALARNSGRECTSAFAYAVAWTHHTTGVQMIRAAGIIQALLGNAGRPGAGILALRGHCSIQGSTDIPTLYDMLPSYLSQPHANREHETLADYLASEQTPTGWWTNFPKYAVSLFKAWYGEHATADNDWGYDRLPKILGDHSQLPMTLAMRQGLLRGLMVLGQNVLIGGSNSKLIEHGLANLDWMVVRDTDEVETGCFWKSGQRVRDGEVATRDIETEVFLMPASLASEKAGSFTNAHRLVQWHDKVVDGPGDSRSELWFVYQLGRRLKQLYADSTSARDEAIQCLTWDYPVADDRGEPSADAVLREMNGYTVADGRQIDSFQKLADDGSTACGAWLYCGIYPAEGHNRARSRIPDGSGTHLGWAFSWPANRRHMYNRASADLEGAPWSERKRLVEWSSEEEQWNSPDVLDYQRSKAPGYEPDWTNKPGGMDALEGGAPFIMIADGRAWIFAPTGVKDGPLPTHYEPVESPIRNPLHGCQDNPVAKKWEQPGNEYHAPEDKRFPYVLTTYRLTEHHCGGTPTRGVPLTAELQPEGFVEIAPELATDLGVANLDWVVLSTQRGEVEARALVTERLRPLEINGRTTHHVGMPWHFGWIGYATGGVANTLTAIVGEPTTSIHENKSLTCNIRKGRRTTA